MTTIDYDAISQPGVFHEATTMMFVRGAADQAEEFERLLEAEMDARLGAQDPEGQTMEWAFDMLLATVEAQRATWKKWAAAEVARAEVALDIIVSAVEAGRAEYAAKGQLR